MGSANLTKSADTAATARANEADRDTIRVAKRTDDAELRLLVPALLLEAQGLDNATCHGTQEHNSLCTPTSTISLKAELHMEN